MATPWFQAGRAGNISELVGDLIAAVCDVSEVAYKAVNEGATNFMSIWQVANEKETAT